MSFNNCNAILFDFGGTLDSDGEHWLDRFYELYEDVNIGLPREEIKRVFYHADALCCSDPCVPKLGLRSLMQHHVRLQMEGLGLSEPALEDRLVKGFCSRAEWFLVRNTSLLGRLRRCARHGSAHRSGIS